MLDASKARNKWSNECVVFNLRTEARQTQILICTIFFLREGWHHFLVYFYGKAQISAQVAN